MLPREPGGRAEAEPGEERVGAEDVRLGAVAVGGDDGDERLARVVDEPAELPVDLPQQPGERLVRAGVAGGERARRRAGEPARLREEQEEVVPGLAEEELAREVEAGLGEAAELVGVGRVDRTLRVGLEQPQVLRAPPDREDPPHVRREPVVHDQAALAARVVEREVDDDGREALPTELEVVRRALQVVLARGAEAVAAAMLARVEDAVPRRRRSGGERDPGRCRRGRRDAVEPRERRPLAQLFEPRQLAALKQRLEQVPRAAVEAEHERPPRRHGQRTATPAHAWSIAESSFPSARERSPRPGPSPRKTSSLTFNPDGLPVKRRRWRKCINLSASADISPRLRA